MTDQNDNMEDLQVTYPGAGTFTLAETKDRCEQLNALVASGKKTVTCLPWSEFDGAKDAMPQKGRTDIIANFDGSPAMVVRTLKVEKIKFGYVTQALASGEGEEKTLESWRKRIIDTYGKDGELDRDMAFLFETFELVEDLGTR